MKASDKGTPLSPASVSRRTVLGTVCVRLGGVKLIWDSENLKVTNVPEANKYLHYGYRQGWSL